MRSVETLSRVALLLVLNFFSSEWSFSFEKNDAYYWLIALTPFRIYSLRRCSRLDFNAWAGLSPNNSCGAGVISVTSGFRAYWSSTSMRA